MMPLRSLAQQRTALTAAEALRPGPQHLARAAAVGRAGRRWDPRLYQIAVLSGLLAYGTLALDFAVGPATIATLLASALGTQALLTRWFGLPRFDPRSPLISGLSLCLLLRVDSLPLAAAAAAVTIASKFLIRFRGKHVFNPTNFGLVAMMLATDRAWVSPGQWGSVALVAGLVACLGLLVVHRAERWDVTWAFLAFYLAVLCGRAAWLGDPLAIPLHQLQSGALLIFAFFMISDPKTTPDSRAGRILFAALVALGAAWVHFGLYRPNGFLWSLAACAPFTPLIDRLLPAPRYQWPGATTPLAAPTTGPLRIARRDGEEGTGPSQPGQERSARRHREGAKGPRHPGQEREARRQREGGTGPSQPGEEREARRQREGGTGPRQSGQERDARRHGEGGTVERVSGSGASGWSEASDLRRDGGSGGKASRACLSDRRERVRGAPGAPPKAPLVGSDRPAAPDPGTRGAAGGPSPHPLPALPQRPTQQPHPPNHRNSKLRTSIHPTPVPKPTTDL